MADDNKSIISRVVEVWPLLVGASAVAGFVYTLHDSTGQNARDIVAEKLAREIAIGEVKAEAEAREHRREDHDKAQDEHLARIDDSRSINLQRVATLEQGQKMTQEILGDIRDKIDRMLMAGFGPSNIKR